MVALYLQPNGSIKIIRMEKLRRDVFQAISDPVRRDILELVAKKPMNPNAVADHFEVSRQAVSKHIKILSECGLLSLRIEGREYYYSLQAKKLEEVNEWLEPFRKMWDDRFSQLDKILLNQKSKKWKQSAKPRSPRTWPPKN
jgi:DNA-binding transcriptional ArsR family regulator